MFSMNHVVHQLQAQRNQAQQEIERLELAISSVDRYQKK